MKHLTFKGKVIVFDQGYGNKYFIPYQILAPFYMLADALLGIILLPTKYQSNIYGYYLHKTVKKQMQKRLKNHEKGN
jgi:hypothetical protein